MKILIATPVATPYVTTACLQSLFRLAGALQATNVPCALQTLYSSDLETARNYLASKAIADICSHVLFVDNDIGFSTRTVAKLITSEKDVIGAVYVKKALDLSSLVSNAARQSDKSLPQLLARTMTFNAIPEPTQFVQGGLASFEALGMGLTLISVAALQALVDENIVQRQESQILVGAGFPVYGFFHRILRGNVLMSEDHSFCLRWRQRGGQIWGVIDEDVDHVGPFVYRAKYSDGVSTE